MSIALMSTPPLIVRPVLPTHLLKARARRVIESISRNTSLPISASRLQRSIDELREPDVAFDVAVEAAGEHFAVDAPLHVGDFFRPLVDQQHDQRHARDSSSRSRWLMCCSRIVLPVRGGATISARWPLPSGVSRSITRVRERLRAGFQLQPALRD